MASTIPCDMCEETPATFLVTFTPNGDTVGLGVECVPAWCEATHKAMTDQGLDADELAAEVFSVTVVPTGDMLRLSVGELPTWSEQITGVLDTAATEDRQEPPEPPEPPARVSKGRKPRQRGATGRQAANAGTSDEDWEASGRRLRAVGDPAADGPGEQGEGVSEGQPAAANDHP